MAGMAVERIAAIAPERIRALVALAPIPRSGISYGAATPRLPEDAAGQSESRKTIIDRSMWPRAALVAVRTESGLS